MFYSNVKIILELIMLSNLKTKSNTKGSNKRKFVHKTMPGTPNQKKNKLHNQKELSGMHRKMNKKHPINTNG